MVRNFKEKKYTLLLWVCSFDRRYSWNG